jgi:hypothetical protein
VFVDDPQLTLMRSMWSVLTRLVSYWGKLTALLPRMWSTRQRFPLPLQLLTSTGHGTPVNDQQEQAKRPRSPQTQGVQQEGDTLQPLMTALPAPGVGWQLSVVN